MKRYLELNRPSVWTVAGLGLQVAIFMVLVILVVQAGSTETSSRTGKCYDAAATGPFAVWVDCDELIADRLQAIQEELAKTTPAACSVRGPGLASRSVACDQAAVDELQQIYSALDRPLDEEGNQDLEQRLFAIEDVLRDLCSALC